MFISHWYTVLNYDSFAVTVCLFWLKKHIHYKLFFSDAYKFLEKTILWPDISFVPVQQKVLIIFTLFPSVFIKTYFFLWG